MRLRTVCAVILVAVGCGGATPDPQASIDPGTTGAGSPPEPGGGRVRGPCAPYVDRALACARDEAGGELPADEARLLGEDARDECREWMLDDEVAARLPGALDGCDATDCSEGAFVWYECMLERLDIATYERGAVGYEPPPRQPPERIAPRPIPARADPCEVYGEWMMACLGESLGPAGLPPEAVAPIEDALNEACEGFRSSPPVFAALPGALRACADVGCGAGGSDLSMCLADALAAGVSGGTAAP